MASQTPMQQIAELKKVLEAERAAHEATKAQLAAERERADNVWKANGELRDSMSKRLDDERIAHGATKREYAEEQAARARGFRALDEGVPLDKCNDEKTEHEQIAWAAGWLERAWQRRAENAEAERDAMREERDALYQAALDLINSQDNFLLDRNGERDYSNLLKTVIASRAFREDCERRRDLNGIAMHNNLHSAHIAAPTVAASATAQESAQ